MNLHVDLDDPRLNGVPGLELSYAELTDRRCPRADRNAWDKIGNLAEALGVDALRDGGVWARTKTIAEFAAEILPLLPEGMDLLPLMDATAALVGYDHTTTFEVRRLRTAAERVAGAPVWILASQHADDEAARSAQEALTAEGFVAMTVEVFTKTDRSIHF